jgi:hypothetical protein
MFRDESSKVIQKAHAQWGFEEGPEASTSTPSSTTDRTQSTPDLSEPSSSSSQVVARANSASFEPSTVQMSISPTQDDQGFNFYVKRYLVGHPDEPRNDGELQSYGWIWEPSHRDISTALGLASMANLNGDKMLMIDARRRYGDALRTAGQLIQTSSPSHVDSAARLVVQLALFEVSAAHKD